MLAELDSVLVPIGLENELGSFFTPDKRRNCLRRLQGSTAIEVVAGHRNEDIVGSQRALHGLKLVLGPAGVLDLVGLQFLHRPGRRQTHGTSIK